MQVDLGAGKCAFGLGQLLVNELDGVFRNSVLLFEATVDVFIHQFVDEFNNLCLVGACHRQIDNGSLFADVSGSEAHALGQRQIIVEIESKQTIVVHLGIIIGVFPDDEAVVTRVYPFSNLIFSVDVDFFFNAHNDELFIFVIVFVMNLRFGVKFDIITVDSDFIPQADGLGNLLVEFNSERVVSEKLSCADATSVEIRDFQVHLLDNLFA